MSELCSQTETEAQRGWDPTRSHTDSTRGNQTSSGCLVPKPRSYPFDELPPASYLAHAVNSVRFQAQPALQSDARGNILAGELCHLHSQISFDALCDTQRPLTLPLNCPAPLVPPRCPQPGIRWEASHSSQSGFDVLP